MAPSPLVVVSGGEGFLRRRFLREWVEGNREQGVSINHVDASVPRALEQAFDGGMFFSQRLVVVSNPHKGNLDAYKEHLKEKDPQTIVVLHVEGKPDGRAKFGKWVKTLPPKVHQSFPSPAQYKEDEAAIAFMELEVKRHGKKFDPPRLAKALVGRCGYDLGFLSFEISKMVTLADYEGTDTITSEVVKGAMAPMSHAQVGSIIEALSYRHKKKLMIALDRVPAQKEDPTLGISGALQKRVGQWLQVLSFDSMPDYEIARTLGANPWYIKNKVLPPARAWGKSGVVKLIRALAQAERGVLNGHINAWQGLCANLVSLC